MTTYFCGVAYGVHAVLTPEEALEAARAFRPRIFKRIEKHIGRPVTVEVWGG